MPIRNAMISPIPAQKSSCLLVAYATKRPENAAFHSFYKQPKPSEAGSGPASFRHGFGRHRRKTVFSGAFLAYTTRRHSAGRIPKSAGTCVPLVFGTAPHPFGLLSTPPAFTGTARGSGIGIPKPPALPWSVAVSELHGRNFPAIRKPSRMWRRRQAPVSPLLGPAEWGAAPAMQADGRGRREAAFGHV